MESSQPQKNMEAITKTGRFHGIPLTFFSGLMSPSAEFMQLSGLFPMTRDSRLPVRISYLRNLAFRMISPFLVYSPSIYSLNF
jgi:hypothetical protein